MNSPERPSLRAAIQEDSPSAPETATNDQAQSEIPNYVMPSLIINASRDSAHYERSETPSPIPPSFLANAFGNDVDDSTPNHYPAPMSENNDSRDDASQTSQSTIPDYTFAWTFYRQHYLDEELRIRYTAIIFWDLLTNNQRQALRYNYEHLINQLISDLAPRRGIYEMNRHGWGHVTIAPEHLHANSLD